MKGIEVTVSRKEHDVLVLHYAVTARMQDLRLPPATKPERADGLWRHTCFEAFIRPSMDTVYYEFNMSPSTQWATYRFDSYRSGMSVASGISEPRTSVRLSDESCELEATLALGGVHGLPLDSTWRLGLSAVIEDARGGLSYWALAHPPGQPDFHHSDCFVTELAPA